MSLKKKQWQYQHSTFNCDCNTEYANTNATYNSNFNGLLPDKSLHFTLINDQIGYSDLLMNTVCSSYSMSLKQKLWQNQHSTFNCDCNTEYANLNATYNSNFNGLLPDKSLQFTLINHQIGYSNLLINTVCSSYSMYLKQKQWQKQHSTFNCDGTTEYANLDVTYNGNFNGCLPDKSLQFTLIN